MKKRLTLLKSVFHLGFSFGLIGFFPNSFINAQSKQQPVESNIKKGDKSTDFSTEKLFKGLDLQNEILDKRTKNVKHFLNENGTITAQIGGNYHYKDAAEKWQDININIEQSTRPGFAFQNIKNDVKSFFPLNPQNGVLLISETGKEIKLWNSPTMHFQAAEGNNRQLSAQQKNGIVNGYSIKYPNIYPGISEEFEILNSRGIENNILINELNSDLRNSRSGSMISFQQFIPIQSGWIIRDEKGKEINSNSTTKQFSIQINSSNTLYFGNIIVFDNNTTKEEALSIQMIPSKWTPEMKAIFERSVKHLDYEVKFVNGGIEVSYLLPADWIKNQNRAFPVTVDPEITFTPPSSSGSFYAPLSNWYGYQRTATLYLENELNFNGNISKISYNRTSTTGTASNVPTKIYMKTTPNATLSTEAWNSTSYIGATSALFDDVFNVGTTTGWKDIVLTTPFTYDSDNLIIMINSAYGGSGSAKYYNQTTSTNLSGRQAYRRVDYTDPGESSTLALENYLTEIRLEYSLSVDCDVLPAEITIASSSNLVCADSQFSITSTGVPIASGITYLWQKSIDNGVNWIDSPVTTRVLDPNIQLVTTKYRLQVTCSISNQTVTTNEVTVTNKLAADCICINEIPFNCTDGDVITNVSYLTINQNSACSNPNGYTDYRPSITIPDVDLGQTFPISVTVGPSGLGWLHESVGVWLDFNQNGLLDSLEGEYFPIGTGLNEVLTGDITIPANAVGGNTLLRVVCTASIQPLNIFACGPNDADENFGEMEDYAVNIIIPVVPVVDSVKVNTLGGQAAIINIPQGTLLLTGQVYPSTVNQAVTWSIINETGTATVSTNGLVTASTNGNVWVKITSIEDPTKMDSIKIVITNQDLGIKNFGANDLIVYPNPTQHNITLQSNSIVGNVDILIMDIQGKIIFTDKISENEFSIGHKINFADFANGVYILQLNGNAINYKQNIIKQ